MLRVPTSDTIPYDRDMLQFLRESVYDGSIPKPRPKQIIKPKPQGLTYNHPRPTQHQKQHTPTVPSSSLLAQDHTTNFQPNTTTSSSHFNSPPSRQTTIRQATHTLWPTPTHSYTHTKSCFHHPSATFNTEPTGAEPATIKLKPIKYPSQPDSESLPTPKNPLVQSIFFRRCNGMYINALGTVWPEPERDHDDNDDNPTKTTEQHQISRNAVAVSQSRLSARESLIQPPFNSHSHPYTNRHKSISSHHLPPEDLIITMWAWHRQYNQQRHHRVGRALHAFSRG